MRIYTMKNTIFIILSILFMAIFFNTCTRHFSPLYYYQEMSRSDNDISGDTDEPEVGGEGILSDAEDPFKTGEWNREDYRGFTLDLDNEYVIAASFGLKMNQHICSLKMILGSLLIYQEMNIIMTELIPKLQVLLLQK